MEQNLNGNLYERLGVEVDASPEEIRLAYRELAMKWHPDRNLENPREATMIFQRINEAHQVLKDANARRSYDFEMGFLARGMDYEQKEQQRRQTQARNEAQLLENRLRQEYNTNSVFKSLTNKLLDRYYARIPMPEDYSQFSFEDNKVVMNCIRMGNSRGETKVVRSFKIKLDLFIVSYELLNQAKNAYQSSHLTDSELDDFLEILEL
jgi:curved DNA-binding protein CbpA